MYKFSIKQSNAILPVAFYPPHTQSAEGSPGFPFYSPLSCLGYYCDPLCCENKRAPGLFGFPLSVLQLL